MDCDCSGQHVARHLGSSHSPCHFACTSALACPVAHQRLGTSYAQSEARGYPLSTTKGLRQHNDHVIDKSILYFCLYRVISPLHLSPLLGFSLCAVFTLNLPVSVKVFLPRRYSSQLLTNNAPGTGHSLLVVRIRAYSAAINCPTIPNDQDQDIYLSLIHI